MVDFVRLRGGLIVRIGMETEILHLTTLAPPKRTQFGEFLVSQRILDRFQLFRALQMQDRMPGARLGQCAVALGYIPRPAIERLHVAFSQVADEALEQMTTDAFQRAIDIEVEVVYPMP
jgi:hypothetical protein